MRVESRIYLPYTISLLSHEQLGLVYTFGVYVCMKIWVFLVWEKAEINFTSPVINIPCSPRLECVCGYFELTSDSYRVRRNCRGGNNFSPKVHQFFFVFIQCSIAVRRDFCWFPNMEELKVNTHEKNNKWVNHRKVIVGCGKHFRGSFCTRLMPTLFSFVSGGGALILLRQVLNGY